MDATFTQAGLQKLAGQTGRRQVVHDPKTTGLRAELREGGAVTFYLFRRMPGSGPLRFRIGTFPQLTVEQARTEAVDLIARMSKGENVAALRRRKRTEPNLQELFDHWLSHAKGRKKTWREDEKSFNKYLVAWKNKRLSMITKPDVKTWHARLGSAHGPYLANRLLALLRAMFNQSAEDVGFDGANPAARVTPFPEVERDRFLQPEELPRFFKALAAEPSENARDFILLAIFTGQRRSNVMQMRWEDVNLERAEWRLPETKQGKPHYASLAKPVVELLKRRRRDAEPEAVYVLEGRHHGKPMRSPDKAWKRILTAAGLKDVRIHDLRRTLGSYMAIGGASLNIIGAALGHARHETTAIYARLTTKAVASNVVDAVKLIEASAKPKRSRKR
jgi:integrase